LKLAQAIYYQLGAIQSQDRLLTQPKYSD